MDNQHKLIKGYRDLSQAEIDLMNEIKEQAVVLSTLISKVERHLFATCKYEQVETTIEERAPLLVGVGDEQISVRQGSWSIGPSDDTRRWQTAEPFDWVKRAKNDLQDGFMKLVRSVAQPTTF